MTATGSDVGMTSRQRQGIIENQPVPKVQEFSPYNSAPNSKEIETPLGRNYIHCIHFFVGGQKGHSPSYLFKRP